MFPTASEEFDPLSRYLDDISLVNTRHIDPFGQPVRLLGYQPAAAAEAFECISLAELHDRVPMERRRAHEQLDFDLVIACTDGTGSHEVDFQPVQLDPRRWIHIRPGQIHRWLPGTFEATLILFAPRPRSPHWRAGARTIELTDETAHDLKVLLDLLSHSPRSALSPAVLLAMRDLAVEWLGLDMPDINPDADPLYTAFRQLLAQDARWARNVEHYASSLASSPRTLARACKRAGSAAPKRLIDEAVLFEAQRLLALPHATVTGTAAALHFDEVTNFTKFFRRMSGESPTSWMATTT